MPPIFCQDGARGFFKIDENRIGGWREEQQQIFRKAEGVANKFSVMPPSFITLVKPLISGNNLLLTKGGIFE